MVQEHGTWNIDGDSYQFVPGKMENCDLVKFDDAGNKVEKGQGGFSDQSGDHGMQEKAKNLKSGKNREESWKKRKN